MEPWKARQRQKLIRGYRFEWTLLQIALLVFGAIITYSLYQEHSYIEALQRDRLQGQARFIAENLGRQLTGVSNALAGILDDLPDWDSRISGAAAVTHRLRHLSGAMRDVRVIAIFDAQGTVIAANRDELIGKNFGQREYFKVPRERSHPTTLYVSAPFRTASGASVINIGRALISRKGDFAGIVAAALDSEYFSVLLHSVLYAPDMRASLAHWDGTTFQITSQDLQYPERDQGENASFFIRHLESGQTSSVLTGISRASGEERMIAVHTINSAGLHMDKPLIVSVSRGLSAVYAPWRKRATEVGGLFGVLTLIVSIGTYLLQQRRQALARLAATMDAQSHESNERMNLALDGAGLGLWEWDLPSGKISFNDRWHTMLGYAFSEIEPDVSSWQKLVHPDDWHVIHGAFNPLLNDQTKVFEAEYRMRHKNGDWVWILGRGRVIKRDADGAAVRFMGTHLDITEHKREWARVMGVRSCPSDLFEAGVPAFAELRRVINVV